MKPIANFVPNLAGLLLFAAVVLPIAAGPAQAQQSSAPGLVTLQADDTAVVEILKILADRSGMNIITSPEIQGRLISLRLKDTPFDQALTQIVRASGLGYERTGNMILVASPQTLNTQTGLQAKVFDLEYADPAEVGSALEILTREVRMDETNSRVIMVGTPAQIEIAQSIVDEMDTKPQQVILEARMIEVNTSALKEIGFDWEKITDVTTVITEGYQGSSNQGAMPDDLEFSEFGDFSRVYRQNAAFEIALEALLTDGNARLLTNSKVVTVDGVAAEIFAGETVPVVITSLQQPGGAGGVLQTIQLEKIDVGVRLNILPRISEGGMITTLVEPEVSRILQFVGPDDDLPQTSTRRARTLVRVKDGEKIYLGGLLSEEDRETVKKVPLLGDLPLLGQLFRHYRNEKIRLDLVIEITPRIVGDHGSELPQADPDGVSSLFEK